MSERTAPGPGPGEPEGRFLRACRGLPVDCTPIWLMRQAGRYMKEYRAVRERHTLLEIIRDPELSCQVTLQPMEAFDLDAAIIFADILPPLESLGLRVEFQSGEGPVILTPIRDEEAVRALGSGDPTECCAATLEAIRLAKRALGSTPLIGFSGAPFTLGSYAVQGGASKDFTLARRFMMDRPDLWHVLMARVSDLVTRYLTAQAAAGVDALQLFDTWAGLLGPDDYAEFALPYVRRVVAEVSGTGLPLIYFSVGTGGMLDRVGECGAPVIGVDWRVDLGGSRKSLGSQVVAVQGNLDPVALLTEWRELEQRARRVLISAEGRPGHIFNLGHGVLQQTPAESVRRLVDFVHTFKL